jgi:hypothetical protein
MTKKTEPKTFITAQEFLHRHELCVSNSDKQSALDRTHNDHVSYGLGVPHFMSGTMYSPKDLRGGCLHEDDGMCGHREPTEEELAKINAKLGGTMKLNELDRMRVPGLDDKHERTLDRIVGRVPNAMKRKRGRPKGSKNKSKSIVEIIKR